MNYTQQTKYVFILFFSAYFLFTTLTLIPAQHQDHRGDQSDSQTRSLKTETIRDQKSSTVFKKIAKYFIALENGTLSADESFFRTFTPFHEETHRYLSFMRFLEHRRLSFPRVLVNHISSLKTQKWKHPIYGTLQIQEFVGTPDRVKVKISPSISSTVSWNSFSQQNLLSVLYDNRRKLTTEEKRVLTTQLFLYGHRNRTFFERSADLLKTLSEDSASINKPFLPLLRRNDPAFRNRIANALLEIALKQIKNPSYTTSIQALSLIQNRYQRTAVYKQGQKSIQTLLEKLQQRYSGFTH